MATCFAVTALLAIQPGYALLAGNRIGQNVTRVAPRPTADVVLEASQPDAKPLRNKNGTSEKSARATARAAQIDKLLTPNSASPENSQQPTIRPVPVQDLEKRSVVLPDRRQPLKQRHAIHGVTTSLSNSVGDLMDVGRSLTHQLHDAASAVRGAAQPAIQPLSEATPAIEPAATPGGESAATDAGRHHVALDVVGDHHLSTAGGAAAQSQVAVVHNGETGAVHFLSNSQLVSLAPGASRALPGPGPWTVRFHRGGDFGEAAVTLHAGVYEFAVNESGWLVRRQAEESQLRGD